MAIRGSYEAALRKGVTTALDTLQGGVAILWKLRGLRGRYEVYVTLFFAKIALRGSHRKNYMKVWQRHKILQKTNKYKQK